MSKLNIMYDDWLPVVMVDGTKKEVSLFEAITEAHKIKELQKIGCVNIEEYAIYAFIFDFVQWVYKPTGYDEDEKKEAIEEIFDNGRFEKEQLEDYISSFETKGKTFDLFDQENPFMQMSKKEWNEFENSAIKKTELLPLSKPDFGVGHLAGGNVVFEHGKTYVKYETYSNKINNNLVIPGTEISAKGESIENFIKMTPAELFASILYCVAYKHASGEGSFSSVSTSGKAHPIFVVISGKNLFETICASIGVSSSYDGLPIWEKDSFFITSTVLMDSKMDNNIALTYTPTERIYPYSFEKMFVKKFEKTNYEKLKYNEKTEKDEINTPNKAFDKWIENYPRILRSRDSDKNGNQFVKPIIYAHENLKDKNPVLQTCLLQLQSDSKECDVVNINYNILNEKTNLVIHYYALAYKNSSATQLTSYAETFEWNKKLNEYAIMRLPKLLEFIANIAKKTAEYLTKVDLESRTRREKKEKIKIYSANATSETDFIINSCLYELEHDKYESLTREEGEYLGLFIWVRDKFLSGFEEHIRYLPKQSLLRHAEISDEYYKEIKKIEKRYMED